MRFQLRCGCSAAHDWGKTSRPNEASVAHAHLTVSSLADLLIHAEYICVVYRASAAELLAVLVGDRRHLYSRQGWRCVGRTGS
jgi:hypothetical protein